jgi:hypothetical protein
VGAASDVVGISTTGGVVRGEAAATPDAMPMKRQLGRHENPEPAGLPPAHAIRSDAALIGPEQAEHAQRGDLRRARDAVRRAAGSRSVPDRIDALEVPDAATTMKQISAIVE